MKARVNFNEDLVGFENLWDR